MGTACANCGSALNGRYCADCGQDGEPRLGFREFSGQVVSGLLDVDSRFWRTLRDLAVPGRITAEYLAGRRVRYLPPVQTYLLSALLFFAVLGPGTFATLTDSAYRASIVALAAERGVSPATLHAEESARHPGWSAERAAFERRTAKISLLMLVMLPLLGLAMHAINLSKPFRYLEQLVFAFHLQTVIWAVLAAFLAVEALLLALWWPPLPIAAWLVAVAAMVLHASISMKRVWQDPWAVASVKLVGVGAAFFLLIGGMTTVVERIWGSS